MQALEAKEKEDFQDSQETKDPNRMIIIGISGASGSGKSLISKTIVNELGSSRVAVVSEDAYYKDLSHLPFEQRANVNFDHPDSIDHELLYDHLKRLQAGEEVQMPVYDYVTHTRSTETVTLNKSVRIIVLEGILLLTDPKLRQIMDIRIFVDTPSDICFIRRLLRDTKERGRTMDSVIDQYQKTVRPMFLQFIEPSKRYADLIVPHGGKNRIAIDMIKAKMREMLGAS